MSKLLKLFVLSQYILPKHFLTKFAGFLANYESKFLSKILIKYFIWRYKINMNEVLNDNLNSYKIFNDFFVRELKKDARIIDKNADFICPVDGMISQCGDIKEGLIIQAKNHDYLIDELLAEKNYYYKTYVTIYLSPTDYHRIHIPCDAKLLKMVYIPGNLFPVNQLTVAHLPNLFAQNERVVCTFEDINNNRQFTMILIGATIVGSIYTNWHGIVNIHRKKIIQTWIYESESKNIYFKKGDEIAKFLLGSTVIMLFPENVNLNSNWQYNLAVKLGESMARYNK